METSTQSPDLNGVKVVVLMGGPGSEREVSLRTGASIARALGEAGVDVAELVVDGPGFQLPEDVGLAFIAIHGTYGEDGGIQAELEGRGIPYTGAGVVSSRLAFDKLAAKAAFIAAEVPTPAHTVVDSAGAGPAMSLPLVLKPLKEGSSVGVHIVHDISGWSGALADVLTFGPVALCEQFIRGRELTVGILGDNALPVVEIRPRSGFYDKSNKYPWMNQGGGSDYYCPADISGEATAAVQAAAVAAHRALGVEVYSRVDVLLDEADKPWVLEVNTIPGMTESSLLPKAAQVAGMNFADLCLVIARLSLVVRQFPNS